MDNINNEPKALDNESFEDTSILDLFFAPRRFFNTTLKRGNNPYLIAITIIIGISTAIDRFDQELFKVETGKTSMLVNFAETWVGFWIASILTGLVSAIFIWHLGGWWYRTRLKFSGADDPDKYTSRYIYLYASFVSSAPVVLIALIYTLSYSNYIEAYNRDVYLSLIALLFLFYSLYISYSGARKMFTLSKWKARFWLVILPSLFYLFILGAFGFFLQKYNEDQHTSSRIIPEDRIIVSTDNTCQIKLPESWSILKNLNDEASLQVGSLENDAYGIVFVEKKEEMEEQLTVHEYYDIITESMLFLVNNGEIVDSDIADNQEFNIRKGKVYGEADYMDIVYFINIFESEHNYYQLLCWTQKEFDEEMTPVFEEVAASFHEVKDNIQ